MMKHDFLNSHKTSNRQYYNQDAHCILWEAIWRKAIQDERRKARCQLKVDKLNDKTLAKIQQNVLKEANEYSIKSGEIVYVYRREL